MSVGTHYIADLYNFKDDKVFTKYLSTSNYHIFDEYIKSSLKKNGMTLINSMIHHFEGMMVHLLVYTYYQNHISVFTLGLKIIILQLIYLLVANVIQNKL